MLKRYKTVLQFAEIENVIEKSRFIGYVKPVHNENDAISFVEEIKTLHKNATHNVPVYVLGKHYDIQRYSDDGEPSGTAGIPILEMLKKEEIKNVAIVVTRYYGGIKLGTGGLVRAYTSTAKMAVKKSKIIEKVLYDIVKIRIDYHLLGKVQNCIINGGYYIKDTTFDDAVNLYACIETESTKEFSNMVTNLTNAKSEISIIETKHLDVLDGKIIEHRE